MLSALRRNEGKQYSRHADAQHPTEHERALEPCKPTDHPPRIGKVTVTIFVPTLPLSKGPRKQKISGDSGGQAFYQTLSILKIL